MNEATLEYVRQHANDDVRQLALRGSKDAAVDMTAALQQIAGLQVARRKLPSWAAKEGLLYPPHLAMEQCSSEQTARYKAQVISGFSEKQRMVDLTGGFGIDFSFLAPLFDEAIYVERQKELCRLARHNFSTLGTACEVVCTDSTDYLQQLDQTSVIFIDPARRDASGARTYGLSDCTPDVLQLRPLLLQKARYVVMKLSPMLDWRKTVSDLGQEVVREVHIVAVGGECKELLLVLSAEGEGLRLICTNDDELFEASNPMSPVSAISPISPTTPVRFLYEPNAAIMKAGCFGELSQRFGISQLAQNSHLFVSDRLVSDFPGRKFRIKEVSSMNKRELKEKITPLSQANITVRNFPLTVAELRKRLKMSEGGSNYIFATTLANGDHVLMVCQKEL